MPSHADDDRTLVERILRGESEAATEFVDRFERLIYTILKQDFHLDDNDSGDVYGSVVEQLIQREWHALRQWRGTGKLSSYVARITHNVAHDYLRARARLREETGSGDPEDETAQPQTADEAFDFEEFVYRRQLVQIAIECLEHLSERYREAVRRRHLLQESHAEIAHALGIPEKQVGIHLARGEQRLVKIMRERYPALLEGVFEES